VSHDNRNILSLCVAINHARHILTFGFKFLRTDKFITSIVQAYTRILAELSSIYKAGDISKQDRTNLRIAAGVGRAFSRVCLSVCLFVCPRTKMKTAWAITFKPGTHIFYPRKRRHSRWKLRQELKWKIISFLPHYTYRYTKMAGRKSEKYKIDPRISVPFMLELEYESKIISKNY